MGLEPRKLVELTAFIVGGCLAFVDGLPAYCLVIGGVIMWAAFVAALIDGSNSEENTVRADDREHARPTRNGTVRSHAVHIGNSGSREHDEIYVRLPVSYPPRTHKRSR